MSAAEIMSPEAAATEAAEAVAPIPWHAWLLLFQPRRVLRGLSRVEGVGLAERAPTLWQIELGVLRMWERMFFRSDTIGTCKDGRIRPNLRARLMNRRPLRFPFLVWERVITPWDLSGFLSSKQQAIRHLLGAHHDGTQFVYDLQLLQLHPGGLEELEQQAAAVAAGDTARARWLADLTVYEGYHQALLDGVRGWNQKLVQTGLDGDIEPKRGKDGTPVCFGHFAVSPTPEGGTLLDYGKGGNGLLDPTRLVRDPLVSLRGQRDAHVLLGYTWLKLGPLELSTPSWFVLEHAGPVEFVAPRPG